MMGAAVLCACLWCPCLTHMCLCVPVLLLHHTRTHPCLLLHRLPVTCMRQSVVRWWRSTAPWWMSQQRWVGGWGWASGTWLQTPVGVQQGGT